MITDHSSLTWLKNSDSHSRTQKRLYRWWDKLEANFSFNIIYREGKKNLIADTLSRNPLKTRLNVIKNLIVRVDGPHGGGRATAVGSTPIYPLTRRKQRIDYKKLHKGQEGRKRLGDQNEDSRVEKKRKRKRTEES